jgi:O-antigen/teichoic acid export membrane protein
LILKHFCRFQQQKTLSDNPRMKTFPDAMNRTLAKPVLVQLAGALFCASVSFGLTVVLARVFGPERLGHYVAVLNLAAVALIFQEGGWPTLLYRESAVACGTLPHQSTALAWGHVLVATAGLSALCILMQAPSPWATACLCMGAVAAMNMVSSRMRGCGLFTHEAVWQSTGRVISAVAILAFLAVSAAPDITGLFIAWGVGLAVVLAWGARPWLGWPRWPWADGWPALARNYQQLWPFVVMTAAGAWLVKGDMVLLGLDWGLKLHAQDVSMYAACTRLTEAGLLVFAPFTNVLYRRLNQLHAAQDADALSKNGWRSVALALCLGALGVGCAVWIGDAVMALLFGPAFAAAGALLPWVACMLPLTMANLVVAQWLTALGRERVLSVWMLLTAGMLSVSLPLWAAHWSVQGAAMAVAAAQGVLLCLSCVSLVRARQKPTPLN